MEKKIWYKVKDKWDQWTSAANGVTIFRRELFTEAERKAMHASKVLFDIVEATDDEIFEFMGCRFLCADAGL